jgi:hypothetical protein
LIERSRQHWRSAAPDWPVMGEEPTDQFVIAVTSKSPPKQANVTAATLVSWSGPDPVARNHFLTET